MKGKKSKPANCTQKIKACKDVAAAQELLRELQKERMAEGYECQDLLLGMFRYELLDGFVIVAWENGWITEEAYEYID